MQLQPLNDEILIREKVQDEKTTGGIYIPNTVQNDAPIMGEVVAVSAGILLENGKMLPHAVEPGNVVLFEKRTATEVKVDGEKLLLIRSVGLLAKVLQ